VANRLRAVEHAYRMANERDTVSSPPDAPERSALPSMCPTGRSSWSRAAAERLVGRLLYRTLDISSSLWLSIPLQDPGIEVGSGTGGLIAASPR
jgi:hypothetical protein